MTAPSLRSRVVRRGLVAAVEAVRARSGGTPDPDGPVEQLEAYALEVRDALEQLARRVPGPGTTTVVTEVDCGVPALWVEDDRAADADRALLHLHGGAYALGSPRTHRGLAAALSRVARAPVLLPEYRLAPENPFPAALDDALAAYRWLTRDRGIAPRRVAVTGDSAGGGLAVALLVSLRDAGEPMPACYAGMSPWTDLAGTGRSMTERDELDPWLSAALAAPAARAYAGATPLDDPLVSPLYADLSDLPPMLVHVGTDEILLDDARRLVDRAREHGTDASLGVFEGLWHVFHLFPGFPESRLALQEIGGFVRRHTDPLTARSAA